MLEVIDIHTYYGESYILQGISLEVKGKSVVALLGRNGMGKTTTIRSISGLTPPRRGIIQFKGNNLTHLKPYQIAQMGIALVPQGRHVFRSLSVERNLTVASRNLTKLNAWSLNRVYSFFPILEKRAKYKANLLSGGEQQMLTISRALMTNPELTLMDEPSEGLAPLIVQEISRIIGELKKSGLSILMVEQNLSMALALADDVYIISKGKTVYHSSPQQLTESQEVQAMYLGATGGGMLSKSRSEGLHGR